MMHAALHSNIASAFLHCGVSKPRSFGKNARDGFQFPSKNRMQSFQFGSLLRVPSPRRPCSAISRELNAYESLNAASGTTVSDEERIGEDVFISENAENGGFHSEGELSMHSVGNTEEEDCATSDSNQGQIPPNLSDQGIVSGSAFQGDTAGAALLLEDVRISVGDRDLVSDATWRLMPTDRAGLVGVNGCGKSTLLRSITGQQIVDRGTIVIPHGTKLGYLEQTAVSGSTRTVWEEAKSRMDEINAAESELNAAQKSMENSEEGALERFTAAQEAFEAVDGYKAPEMIARVLNGLGFEQSDWTKPCSEFSGGWQMRIALARLLLSQVSHQRNFLLLLDEPTNHLDAKARVWLADYLSKASSPMIIVSHDVDLLRKTCTHIAEIHNGELNTYVGNYDKYIRDREERRVALMKEVESKKEEMQKLQNFIDRFGAKATKASAANSKKKALEKIEASLPQGSNLTTSQRSKVSVKLPPPPTCAKEILFLKEASIGWASTSPLLQDVDLKLEMGMRMVILGPNGCGKSTLMSAIAGKPTLLRGERIEGMGIKLGYFTQDLAQDLPQEVTGFDYVAEVAREYDSLIPNEKIRSALGCLGLSGESVFRKIKFLSGGEKARVALACFMLKPHNVLLLDEASNHLDQSTIRALAEALETFKGTLVAISHAQEFCRALNPTHVARVQNGKVNVSLCINGELRDEDFLESRIPHVNAAVASAASPTTSSPPSASSGSSPSLTKQERKELLQLQSRIKKVLAQIEKYEQEAAALDEEMMTVGSDADKAMKALKKKEGVLSKMALLEREWEELEEKVLAMS